MSLSKERLFNFWITDQENAPLFCDLLVACIQDNLFDEVLALYNQAPSHLQLIPFVIFKQIDAHIALNDFESALSVIFKQKMEGNNLSEIAYYEALILFLSGDLQKAKSVLDGQNEFFSLNENAQILSARLHYISGDIDKAVHCLNGLLESSANSEAIGLLAMCYLDLMQYEQANKLASHALSINDKQVDALLAISSVALLSHEFLIAKQLVERCLSIMPNLARAWSVKGQCSLLNNELELAYDELKKAINLDFNHIGTWHLLAWACLLLNKTDEAKTSFLAALDINTSFADSHGGLAIIAHIEGDLILAEKLAKKANRLDPNSFTGVYASALLKETSGSPELAEKMVSDQLAQPSYLSNKSYQDLISDALDKFKDKNGS